MKLSTLIIIIFGVMWILETIRNYNLKKFIKEIMEESKKDE